jgi:hypothetical protein
MCLAPMAFVSKATSYLHGHIYNWPNTYFHNINMPSQIIC